MTIWKPDTCKCVADVETQLLIKKCKMHTTYHQMLKTNQDINHATYTIGATVDFKSKKYKDFIQLKRKLKLET